MRYLVVVLVACVAVSVCGVGVGTSWGQNGQSCRADINSDGAVDFADFLLFAKAFQEEEADLNQDGVSNFTDFVFFAEAYKAKPRGCHNGMRANPWTAEDSTRAENQDCMIGFFPRGNSPYILGGLSISVEADERNVTFSINADSIEFVGTPGNPALVKLTFFTPTLEVFKWLPDLNEQIHQWYYVYEWKEKVPMSFSFPRLRTWESVLRESRPIDHGDTTITYPLPPILKGIHVSMRTCNDDNVYHATFNGGNGCWSDNIGTFTQACDLYLVGNEAKMVNCESRHRAYSGTCGRQKVGSQTPKYPCNAVWAKRIKAFWKDYGKVSNDVIDSKHDTDGDGDVDFADFLQYSHDHVPRRDGVYRDLLTDLGRGDFCP